MLNFYITGNGVGTAYSNLPKVRNPATTVMLVDGGANPQSSTNQDPKKPTTWKESIGGGPAGPNTLVTNNHGPWLLLHAGSTTLPDTTFYSYGGPLARHNDICNVLWCDGHAKATRIESFYTPYQTGSPQ